MALGSHCSLIGLLSRKALCVCVCKEFVVTVKFQSLLVSRNLGVYASRSFKGASRPAELPGHKQNYLFEHGVRLKDPLI